MTGAGGSGLREQPQSTHAWPPARQSMGVAPSPARWVWPAQLCSEAGSGQTPAAAPRVRELAPAPRAGRPFPFLPVEKAIYERTAAKVGGK